MFVANVDDKDVRYAAGRVWRDGSGFDAIVSVTTDEGPAPSNEIHFGGSRYDHIRSIVVESSGNIFVAGRTESEDLPATAGRFQAKCGNGPIPPDGQSTSCMNAFVAKIWSTDRHVWATYLGGKMTEDAWSVGLDAAGNVYAAGFMGSSDFPLRNAAFSPRPHTDDPNPYMYRGYGTTDCFLTKLVPDGTKAIYSTALGGQLWNGGGMTVDPDGTATFVGTSGDTNPHGLPLVASHHGPQGDLDATLVTLNPAGTLRHFVKFGGTSHDGSVAVHADGYVGSARCDGGFGARSVDVVRLGERTQQVWLGPGAEQAVQVTEHSPAAIAGDPSGCACRAAEFGAMTGERERQYWLFWGAAALVARRRFEP